jgi:hypothetical protein
MKVEIPTGEPAVQPRASDVDQQQEGRTAAKDEDDSEKFVTIPCSDAEQSDTSQS